MTKRVLIRDILGGHPRHDLGMMLKSSDTYTKAGVPHRALIEADGQHDAVIDCLREMLMRHHVSPEVAQRDKKLRKAMRRLGFHKQQARIKHFPTNPSTQKGNLAEIVLAEYLISATALKLPVYRLRYNPNIDQAMKGDDVLAFDLDSDPVRIIVGEAKFRTTSSKAAVVEMVSGLSRSHKSGIPVSLQFVADRLFEMGDEVTGNKVLECAILFALDKLHLDYVGLLMSDLHSSKRLHQHTKHAVHRLAVISFGLDSPNSVVEACYDGLEGQI